jgi:hypothetical protein
MMVNGHGRELREPGNLYEKPELAPVRRISAATRAPLRSNVVGSKKTQLLVPDPGSQLASRDRNCRPREIAPDSFPLPRSELR